MLDASRLPTDSLYKFMALAGLTTALVSGWWLANTGVEQRRSRIVAEAAGDSSAHTLALVMFEQGRRRARLDSSPEYFAHLDSARARSDTVHWLGDPLRYHGIAHMSDKALAIYADSVSATLAKRANELQAVNDTDILLEAYFRYIEAACVLGGLLALAGFWLWYFRIQIHHDAILKRQADDLAKS